MNKLLKIVIPIAIIGVGVALAVGLVATAPKIDRKPPTPKLDRVEVQIVSLSDRPVLVEATGTVTAAQEVSLSAQVSGKLVEVSSHLIPGGRFQKGQVLARIDPRDFELAVRQEQGRVRQAELELELERGRGAVAAREWEILGGGRDPATAGLALRKPHLATAEQNVEAARSGLARAQLSLERTVLRAPFNALVVRETVDVGQVVSPGASLATLAGSDLFWVKVSVPVAVLTDVQIPGIGGATEGSMVRVTQHLGPDAVLERDGRVVGLAGQLDPQTRNAELLVGIENPVDPADGGLPLLPGAFVRVEIEGTTRSNVAAVARTALVNGDSLWVVGEGDRLERRDVEIAWRGAEEVFLSGGVQEGERVVTSRLARAVVGAQVKVQER
jgi:RND family efflux transporter MFP subunit